MPRHEHEIVGTVSGVHDTPFRMKLTTAMPITRLMCAGGRHPPGDNGLVTVHGSIKSIAMRLIRSFAQSEDMTSLHIVKKEKSVVEWLLSRAIVDGTAPSLDVLEMHVDWRTHRVVGTWWCDGSAPRLITGTWTAA